ncbi:AraC-like DNA-binding protein [Tenacibaculum sp. 190130A14a]|uniref:AraC-like DNA-binding protein n=1 Tax=Tenacibaculum polynesiense TaxID=3137857 RepID=A0ABM9PF47_9FLAO
MKHNNHKKYHLLSIEISLLQIVSLVAIVHYFVLSLVILFSKFFKSSTNNYLGYTLFIIALVGMNNWFWDRGSDPTLLQWFDLALWQFLYPTTLLIFFYKSSQNPLKKAINIQLLYLPFIILSSCNIYISLARVFNWYTLPEIIQSNVGLFYRGISLLSILFPFFTIILSYQFVKNSKDIPSKKWLLYLWMFLSVLEVFGIVLEGHRFLFSEKLPLTYLWTIGSLFLYWFVYQGLYQFKLSNDRYAIKTKERKVVVKSEKSLANQHSYFSKLLFLLEQEKIHHDASLSRDRVAEQLGISSGYLLQVIKENAGLSFSEFINSYRIKDVKAMLKDPSFDKYSLLSIGLECGFNSKTSFYTNFKKETGLTPKEFKYK